MSNVYDAQAKSGFGGRARAWANSKKDELDNLVRITTFELFARVVLRSPVDTGKFRGNWRATVNAMPSDAERSEDRSGNVALTAIRASVREMKAGDVAYLMNPLPYGRALEYGYSGQAPAGMLAVTLLESDQIMAEALSMVRR